MKQYFKGSPKVFDVSRYMNSRSATSPMPHPNGEDLLFLSDMSGVAELWAMRQSEGGWPRQLTFFGERVLDVRISPFSGQALVATDVGGNRRGTLHQLTDLRDVLRLSGSDSVFRFLGPWAPDGVRFAFASNYRDIAAVDVHVGTAGEPLSTARNVMQGGVLRPMAWSPTGDHVIVVRTRTNFDQELILLDVASGAQTTLSKDFSGSTFSNVRWLSRDRIVMLSDALDGEFKELVSYSVSDGRFEQLVSLGTDIDDFCVVGSGEFVLIANEEGYSQLFASNGQTVVRKDVALPRGVYSTPVEAHGKLYLAVEGPRHNSNVWTLDRASDEAKQITHVSNGNVSTCSLVEPTCEVVSGRGGIDVPVLVYSPHGGCKGAPAIVDVHGGPESQRRPRYNPFTQYLVSRGYVVLHPNIRGSAGYGRTYVHLDDVDRRMDSLADVTSVGNWAVEKLGVDPARLGLMGCSYGGYMTFLGLAFEPALWRAGVSVVGISSFVTMLEDTAPWRRSLREAEYGTLELHYDLLRSCAPIEYAHRIDKPLMIVHGVNDPIVPASESRRMIARLADNRGTVETLFLEDEGHTENHDTAFTRVANNVRVFSAIAEFFEEHLR